MIIWPEKTGRVNYVGFHGRRIGVHERVSQHPPPPINMKGDDDTPTTVVKEIRATYGRMKSKLREASGDATRQEALLSQVAKELYVLEDFVNAHPRGYSTLVRSVAKNEKWYTPTTVSAIKVLQSLDKKPENAMRVLTVPNASTEKEIQREDTALKILESLPPSEEGPAYLPKIARTWKEIRLDICGGRKHPKLDDLINMAIRNRQVQTYDLDTVMEEVHTIVKAGMSGYNPIAAYYLLALYKLPSDKFKAIFDKWMTNVVAVAVSLEDAAEKVHAIHGERADQLRTRVKEALSKGVDHDVINTTIINPALEEATREDAETAVSLKGRMQDPTLDGDYVDSEVTRIMRSGMDSMNKAAKQLRATMRQIASGQPSVLDRMRDAAVNYEFGDGICTRCGIHAHPGGDEHAADD